MRSGEGGAGLGSHWRPPGTRRPDPRPSPRPSPPSPRPSPPPTLPSSSDSTPTPPIPHYFLLLTTVSLTSHCSPAPPIPHYYSSLSRTFLFYDPIASRSSHLLLSVFLFLYPSSFFSISHYHILVPVSFRRAPSHLNSFPKLLLLPPRSISLLPRRQSSALDLSLRPSSRRSLPVFSCWCRASSTPASWATRHNVHLAQLVSSCPFCLLDLHLLNFIYTTYLKYS